MVLLFRCGKRHRMRVRELGDITLHQWPNQGGTSPSGSLFSNWHSTVTLEEKQNRARSEQNQKVWASKLERGQISPRVQAYKCIYFKISEVQAFAGSVPMATKYFSHTSFSQKSSWPVVPPRKINRLEAVQFRNESEDPKWTSDPIKPLRLLISTPCRGTNPEAQLCEGWVCKRTCL